MGSGALFAGAYALLRNPSGHREVDYDDVAEAAEAVGLSSLLMRILDRVEQRQALVSVSKAPTDLTPGQPGIGSDAPVP